MTAAFYKASSSRKAHRGKQETRYGLRAFASIAACGLLTGCAGLRTCGPDDAWFGPDKAKHVAVTAGIGAGVVFASPDLDDEDAAAAGFAAAMTAGVAKEWYDNDVKKTCFSWKDLVWDFIGASIGITVAEAALD